MTTLKSRIAQARNFAPHLFVVARAGTGKTTTLIEGLNVLAGKKPSITPSPQQQEIWHELLKSKGARTIAMTAFNKSIAKELSTRVPRGVEAKTMHGFGFGAVRKYFNLRPNDTVDGNKTLHLLERVTGIDTRKQDKVVRAAVNKLVGLCKANLVDPTPDELQNLSTVFGLELDGKEQKIFQHVVDVLDIAKNNVEEDGFIDFNDMIWLPVVHNLPIFQFDLLLVDESQDLNRCQQELAIRAGKRLIFCGDPRQAIYGFAGADTMSMSRMFKRLNTHKPGAVELPLTITRRCSKAVIAHVNRLVADIEAHESNATGSINSAWLTGKDIPAFPIGKDSEDGTYLKGHNPEEWSYHGFVKDGDMVLCRTNAPLVSQCFKFLSKKRKANIQGKDLGTNLINIINSTKATSVEELFTRIEEWHAKVSQAELNRKFPSETVLIHLADKRDCILLLAEGHETVDEVIATINQIFTDEKTTGILLSSGHKAKGLEAENVFILATQAVPHPMAKTKDAVEQEYNLQYVMETRARVNLTYVYPRK